MYPEWVEKYHIEGTSVKKIKENYYLYKVTSKRVEGKNYPVSIQKYIGKITPEGVIEPEKISFIPGIDKIRILSEIIDVENKDKSICNKIAVIENDGYYYCGKITELEKKVILKYFNYDNGKIWR